MPVPFRIAIRQEGNLINAYYAKPDSMDDSILIASLLRTTTDLDDDVFVAFRDLMQLIANQLCQKYMGETPKMELRDPPAHEVERH